jgi:hypothetical protein
MNNYKRRIIMITKYRLGGILAAIAAVIGIIGHFILFFQWYQMGMHTESAEPGCEILLKTIHPLLANLGFLGAAMFAVSAYGYFIQRRWAFLLSVVGIILALLGSFFVNIPYMAAGLPPVYLTLFLPYLVIYFLMLRMVEGISWSRTLLALLTGISYIVCWMNGVSSTSRIITIGADIFVLVQNLHWVAMIGWGVVTAGILIKPREWQRVLGLVSGLTELIVGLPLAFVTAQQLGRFSLFALAPIISLVLVIMLVIPSLWKKWTRYEEKPA